MLKRAASKCSGAWQRIAVPGARADAAGVIQNGNFRRVGTTYARSFATEEGTPKPRLGVESKPEGNEQPPKPRPQLVQYEQALWTSIWTPSLKEPAAADKVERQKAGDADILPRVKLERFLRSCGMPSAFFSYKELNEAADPLEKFICTVRAAGRASEGRGASRFDATQQACHRWIDDYMILHIHERKMHEKARPRVKD